MTTLTEQLRRYSNLIERVQDENLLSFWDLIKHYNISNKEKSALHDAVLPWLNNNSTACINRAIKNENFRFISKLEFYFDHIIKFQNYSNPVTTVEQFEASLSQPITLWRGGGNTYDPERYTLKWASFTANKDRVKTFSEYNGTYGMKGFHILPKREHYWQVELTMPFNEILLYMPQGVDDEVVVPITFAKKAKVIVQT